MSNPNTERDERVRQIRERQKWRANASMQNGRTPESNNTYADIDYLLSLIDSQAATTVTPTTPLLQKIVEIADLGSAQEFGDALERLRAIRGLIIGENV